MPSSDPATASTAAATRSTAFALDSVAAKRAWASACCPSSSSTDWSGAAASRATRSRISAFSPSFARSRAVRSAS